MIIEIKGYTTKNLEKLQRKYIKTSYLDWENASENDRLNDSIIACYEMVIFCLTYKQEYLFYDKGELQKYGLNFISEFGLTEDMVKNIFLTEKKFFEKNATVINCTSTDGEGITYNSVMWAK